VVAKEQLEREGEGESESEREGKRVQSIKARNIIFFSKSAMRYNNFQ